jgi:hypothetical protein
MRFALFSEVSKQISSTDAQFLYKRI